MTSGVAYMLNKPRVIETTAFDANSEKKVTCLYGVIDLENKNIS